MPKARSKDPLLAATTSFLLPVLKPFGFQRLGTRRIARVCDDIVHVIYPWYSSWGGRVFYVECFAISLAPPTDFFYLSWGERLRDPRNNHELWSGQTPELADDSVQLIAQLMQNQVLPGYYTRLETTEDFLDLVLLKRTNPDHHVHFQRACCLVKLRRFEEANRELASAIEQYVEDGREWCFPKAAQCDQMLKAIAEGTALNLYEQWKMETIRNLKLEKIAAQKP